MTKLSTVIFFTFFWANVLVAQKPIYELVKDLPYYPDTIAQTDGYLLERCKLDVYYPKEAVNVPVIVWLHGGGLSSGEKHIPEGLLEQGFIVVAANYRLYPKVKHPAYIEDAAAAVAWVFKNIDTYNGDSRSIFVSGHSAGGYLASMVGLDKNYLQKYGVDADGISGLIPLSGHTITHFTVRKEQNIGKTRPIVDQYAPLFHIRKDAPPTLLITGDRKLELMGRYEENAYFWRMMKIIGHPNIELYELDGYDHTGMVGPSFQLMINFIKDTKRDREK
ncbi:alpha/beta hydrolase [Costertonia aggregata]|uniref:Alpha/beta hydrolase n=1 Tax=Costertonia aggregata TaxID=343403 RepID=A0A7H9AMI2_9FLAO|nr:alpha/beta hydrolase [Costertonia aggregata]QLG44648.1 alpha/beta hydrolase [Costertonia aggregata]